MGFLDADHEETAPDAPTLIISRLACSLVGTTQAIKITPGSLAYKAYGQREVAEQFSCNYGFNTHFRDKIAKGKLRITGVGPDEEMRIVELSDHRFYVATLFLPQNSSRADKPHPLIVEYMKAALDFQSSDRNGGIKA
jgi:CTP synthase (UTP-ammonia lyase)